jgi:hypothetical protein
MARSMPPRSNRATSRSTSRINSAALRLMNEPPRPLLVLEPVFGCRKRKLEKHEQRPAGLGRYGGGDRRRPVGLLRPPGLVRSPSVRRLIESLCARNQILGSLPRSCGVSGDRYGTSLFIRFPVLGVGCPLWPWCHSGRQDYPTTGRQLGRPPSRQWARTRLPRCKMRGTPRYVNAGNRCSFISELPAGPAVVPPINGSVGAVGRRTF